MGTSKPPLIKHTSMNFNFSHQELDSGSKGALTTSPLRQINPNPRHFIGLFRIDSADVQTLNRIYFYRFLKNIDT